MAFVSSLCQTKTKGMPSAVHKGLMAWLCYKNLCSLPNKKKKKKESKSMWSSKLKNNPK